MLLVWMACIDVSMSSSLFRARRDLSDILDEMYAAGNNKDNTVENTGDGENKEAPELNARNGSDGVVTTPQTGTYVGSEDTVQDKNSLNDDVDHQQSSNDNSQNDNENFVSDGDSQSPVFGIIDNSELVAPSNDSAAFDDVGRPVENSIDSQVGEGFGDPSSKTDYNWSYEEEYAQSCFDDRHLDDGCKVSPFLEDVSFWDLYSLVFSDSVIEGLLKCDPGDWCLDNDLVPVYWYNLIANRAEEFGNVNVSRAVCEEVALDCIRDIAANHTQCDDYPVSCPGY